MHDIRTAILALRMTLMNILTRQVSGWHWEVGCDMLPTIIIIIKNINE